MDVWYLAQVNDEKKNLWFVDQCWSNALYHICQCQHLCKLFVKLIAEVSEIELWGILDQDFKWFGSIVSFEIQGFHGLIKY